MRTRMSLVVDALHLGRRELGVSLRGGEALVPEHLLDGSQIRAFLQHVSAEGVAQRVRMHVGREAVGLRDAFD